MGRRTLTCARERMGTGMIGPLPRTTSKSMLRGPTEAGDQRAALCVAEQGAPERGERGEDVGDHDDSVGLEGAPGLQRACEEERARSAERGTHAHTCKLSSMAISGVSERSRKGNLSEKLVPGGAACVSGAVRRCYILVSVRSELSHIAARLAHEPYRRALHHCMRQRAVRRAALRAGGSSTCLLRALCATATAQRHTRRRAGACAADARERRAARRARL